MAGETPSGEYSYVLVDEDHPAFRDIDAAKRAAKRRWVAQVTAERTGLFIAKVESYIEPDIGIKIDETKIGK